MQIRGAISPTLRWRWRLVTLLLLAARGMARLLRRLPKGNPPLGHGAVALATAADQVARAAETAAQSTRLSLVLATQKLGLGAAWQHQTFQTLPQEETYSVAMRPTKLLLRAALSVPLPSTERWRSHAELQGLYGLLGIPKARALQGHDAGFGHAQIAGANPLWLVGNQGVEELVAAGLTRPHAAALGLSALSDAQVQRSIFMVNWRPALHGLAAAPQRYLAPCMGLFGASEGGLVPLGIQLDAVNAPPTLLRPDGSPAWELAKMFFSSADLMVHELVSHFLWTHALAEKLVLATARTLSWQHPLRRLLAPHLQSTLHQMQNASQTLLAEGALFDRVLAGGNGKNHLLHWGEETWRFEHLVLPRQVLARGVHHLEDYPYRDDGLLVWQALAAYVSAYVDLWYPDAATVVGDAELSAWSAALRESLRGQLPGLTSVEQLKEVLTGCLFNSVQHNLVNGLQYDMFGWPPAAPAALHHAPPTGTVATPAAALISALPPVAETLQAVRATYGFALQYDRLGAHLERYLPPVAWHLAGMLRRDLARVERQIEARNARRAWPYVAALPSRLSNSVDA